nr:reverse transcriptase domain-containing protein [Tanacetum cinerariifolium]
MPDSSNFRSPAVTLIPSFLSTWSSSKLSRDQTSNPTLSTYPTPKGRIRRSSKQKVENSNFEENPLPLVPMAENQTMAQLLQAPTGGYEDAIVIPEIAATNFELKHGLINLVQNKQFFGYEKEDPHAHLCYFNKITSTMRVNQPLAYQAPTYRAPASQTQGVSQNDFERYIKANDAVLRNIQNQGQSIQNQCQGTQNQLQIVQNQLADLTDMMAKFMSANTASSSGSGTLPGNTVTNPKEDLKGITTQSGVAYQGPTTLTPSKVEKQGTEEIFKEMSFEISFTDALMLMPKFASTLKSLIGNKEKLSEMARTSINEHCSAVILNKLPKKLGDPRKFLIPCKFPGTDECLALADLGASINLMPLSMWKGLLLPELTPTCMTLKLVDRMESKPVGIAKDVKVKVAITYNLDQTSRYSANYDQMTTNKIDVTDEACEEYSKEVLGFFDVTASGSPTPSDDLIVSTTSPALTPFGDSDFLLFEEADAFLGLEDDPDSPELDPSYYDPKGDILSLEVILNSDPSPPFPNHEQFVPSFKEELKACEAKTIKSSIDEPPEVELKDLPPILNMHFWKATTSCLPLLLKH